MRHSGLPRKRTMRHRVGVHQGGDSLRNSSEFHSFRGDRVAAARNVPSVPPGHGEEAAGRESASVPSPTHGSKCPRVCARVTIRDVTQRSFTVACPELLGSDRLLRLLSPIFLPSLPPSSLLLTTIY